MEIDWNYFIVAFILWAIMAGMWWFGPTWGKSYTEVFGMTQMIILTIVLLPISYVIVHIIAER